jgi:hypothetical protein
MTVKKRGARWHFSFQIKGVRYCEAIPEARTKFQAEQAEAKSKSQRSLNRATQDSKGRSCVRLKADS